MSFEKKVRLLTAVLLLCFVAVWLRLAVWQVLSAESLSAAAEAQHFSVLKIPASRGEITFVDGETLVANKSASLLYANLNVLSGDKSAIAESLATVLASEVPMVTTGSAEITVEDRENFLKSTKDELQIRIAKRLNIEGSTWVNLAHFIPAEVKKKIEDFKYEGLGFLEEETRDYPEASLSAHLIGFVGSDRLGNPKGYFGLEGYYERELAGKNGELRQEKDAFGRPIAIGSETRRDKKDGSKLVTTVNRAVQLFTEKELLQAITDWKASGGSAIVMDPTNGEILALANFPQYDPKNFSYFPTTLYKNPAITSIYEPGSIIKPLVMAAAINEGKLTPESRCPDKLCDGPVGVGGYFIRTFNNQYHPNLTMTEVLINSDNTGMVYVQDLLGFRKLYDYYQSYGFSEKTGIDLQEEESGVLRPIDSYYPVEQANLSFGQGIAVNAMQMMRAWASLANSGFLITPHLVRTVSASDEDINLSWPRGRQVLKTSTAKIMTEMLVRVANESAVHFPKDRVKSLANFRIAAKSGTAQIASGGGYKETGTTASVIGYFPADDPRFLVMVKLNEPEVRPWGSDTAGPPFFAIADHLLHYYNVVPN